MIKMGRFEPLTLEKLSDISDFIEDHEAFKELIQCGLVLGCEYFVTVDKTCVTKIVVLNSPEMLPLELLAKSLIELSDFGLEFYTPMPLDGSNIPVRKSEIKLEDLLKDA
jgi:hypothetical protein